MNTPIIITLIICGTIAVIVGLRIHVAKRAARKLHDDLMNMIKDVFDPDIDDYDF